VISSKRRLGFPDGRLLDTLTHEAGWVPEPVWTLIMLGINPSLPAHSQQLIEFKRINGIIIRIEG
jgi:hypothetical protein